MVILKVNVKVGWVGLASICAFSAFIIYKTSPHEARKPPKSKKSDSSENSSDGASEIKTLPPQVVIDEIQSSASSHVSINEETLQVGTSDFVEESQVTSQSVFEDEDISEEDRACKGEAVDGVPETSNKNASYANLRHEIENQEEILEDEIKIQEGVLNKEHNNLEEAFKQGIENPKENLDENGTKKEKTLHHGVKNSNKYLEQEINNSKELPKQNVEKSKKSLSKGIEILAETFKHDIEKQEKSLKQEIEILKETLNHDIEKPEKDPVRKNTNPKTDENSRLKKFGKFPVNRREGLPRTKSVRNFKNNRKGSKMKTESNIQARSEKQSNFFEYYEKCIYRIRKRLAKLDFNTLFSFSQWHSDAKKKLSKPIVCLLKNKNEMLRKKCNCTLECNQTEFVAEFASELRNSLFLTSSSEDIYKNFNKDLKGDMVTLFNDLFDICHDLKSAFSYFREGARLRFQNGSDWDKLKTTTSQHLVRADTWLKSERVTPFFKTAKFKIEKGIFDRLKAEITQFSNIDATIHFDLNFLSLL